ncbi:MAG: hypothetical protein KAH30_02035, partial [Caldisericia bacterium]|nr:hypothetical protein [Caldisericia bacterium]
MRKQILRIFLILVIIAGLVSFNSQSVGVFASRSNTTNQDGYKITHVEGLPDNSLLKPTDDFELITLNLPTPDIVGPEDDDLEFNTWIPDPFQGRGQLEELWTKLDISLALKDRMGSTIYPDGWCIGSLGTGNLYDPKTGVRLDKKYALGNLDVENNLLFKRSRAGALRIINTSSETRWEYDEFLYWGSNAHSYISGKNLITNYDYYGYYSIDISSGKTKWQIRNVFYGDGDMDTMYDPFFDYSDKYFWSIAEKSFTIDESQLYRIKPDGNNIEIMKYDIENPDEVVYVDGEVYIFSTNRDIIFRVDTESGVLKETYDLNDYFQEPELLRYTTQHQFLCKTSNGWYVFNPDDPKNSIRVSGYPELLVNDRNGAWFGWDAFWYVDKDQLYCFNTKTGEKLWWIPRKELGSNPRVMIADWRGI